MLFFALCMRAQCVNLRLAVVHGLQIQMNYRLTNEHSHPQDLDTWRSVHAASPFVRSFTAYCFHMLSFISTKWPLSFKDVMKLAYIGTPWTLENKLEARIRHVLLLHYILHNTYELHNPKYLFSQVSDLFIQHIRLKIGLDHFCALDEARQDG